MVKKVKDRIAEIRIARKKDCLFLTLHIDKKEVKKIGMLRQGILQKIEYSMNKCSIKFSFPPEPQPTQLSDHQKEHLASIAGRVATSLSNMD